MGFTEREAWAYLLRAAGGANPAISGAVARYGAVETAERVVRGEVVGPYGAPLPWPTSGVRDLAVMRRMGARLVTPHDAEWPAAVMMLWPTERPPEPATRVEPVALWVMGTMSLADALKPMAVSIIGSRAATTYGARAAARFAGDVLDEGRAVVAEAEAGIGSAVIHRALATHPRHLLVVLRTGVDVGFASPNARLHQSVVAGGGMLVSEFAPGTRASARTKADRARLMSLTTVGTIVVEAGRYSTSATMHAELTSALGRFVAAVPGPVTSPLSVGTNAMLRGGAHVVASGTDVRNLLHRSAARSWATALSATESIHSAVTARRRTVTHTR